MDKKRTKSRISKKIGLSPGSLVYVGEHKLHESNITLIRYDKDNYTEESVKNIDDISYSEDSADIMWINIDGVHNPEIVEKIGKTFKLHPLLLEDILNTEERPKIEDFDENIFITLKLLSKKTIFDNIEEEQISLVLGKNYVLSFTEKPGDVFNPIKHRAKIPNGKLRTYGPDYLIYALLDVIIDNYFLVIENISIELEELEDKIFTNSSETIIQTLLKNKNDLILLRKIIYPLRDAVSKLQKNDFELINEKTFRYFNDVYDHTIQIIETIESFRDINSGLKDLYLSNMSLKMNKVMQILTVIATIFMPLSFIVGLYGMNFDNMPEIHWKYGYIGIWIIILFITISMLAYFKRKKWF